MVTFAGGRRFTIQLVSNDPGSDHGIAIDDEQGNAILRLGIRTFGTAWYPVDAIPDGHYVIFDPEHPELRATLVVGGGRSEPSGVTQLRVPHGTDLAT